MGRVEVGRNQIKYVALREEEVGEVKRKKEGDPGIFFLQILLLFFFLEILPVGWYLAREQGLRHES
jgi:hypothetical protein